MIFNRTSSIFFLVVFLYASSGFTQLQDLSSDVLLEKAKVQFVFKNYDNAFNLAQQVINLDSKNVEAYLIIAQIHYINGKYKEAKEAYDRILSIEPTLKKDFLRDYGVILKAEKNYSDAMNCFQEFLKDNPEDSLTMYHKGDILFLTGKYEEAEQTIKPIINKHDELYIPAAVLLSEIYIKEKKNDEAERILKTLEKERLSELSTQIVAGIRGKATARKEYYKRLSIEFSLGGGYDSNGIYLTDSESELNIKKDSFYSELNANIVYNPFIDAKKRLYIRFNVLKNFYFSEESKQFDMLLLEPRVGYKFFIGEKRKTLLDFGYTYNNLFFSGGTRVGFDDFGSYFQKNALYLELNDKIGKTMGIIRYDFGFAEYFDHSKSGFEHRLIIISSVPIKERGNFYIGPVVSLDDVRLNLYDNYSIGITSGFQLSIIKELSLVFAVSYEHKDYFDNEEERNDDVLSVSSRLEYLFPIGLFVAGNFGYSLVDSSLDRYAYDKWIALLLTGIYY